MGFALCCSILFFFSLQVFTSGLYITCEPDNVGQCIDEDAICYDCTVGSYSPRKIDTSSLIVLEAALVSLEGEPALYEATDCMAVLQSPSGSTRPSTEYQSSESETERLCGTVFDFFSTGSSVKCEVFSELDRPKPGSICRPTSIPRNGRGRNRDNFTCNRFVRPTPVPRRGS